MRRFLIDAAVLIGWVMMIAFVVALMMLGGPTG